VNGMMTKKKVRQAIDSAESIYMECWKFLSHIKAGRFDQLTSADLTSFQPKLAKAIYDLSEVHRNIANQKSTLLSNRHEHPRSDWLKTRLAGLDAADDLITRAISVGKGIGDGFAWFYYQRDRYFILMHQAEQRQKHAPPGIGGVGEIEFIKNTLIFNGY